MKNIIAFLMRLGVVEGITFRCEVEDGVGPILTPNPRVTRMNPQAVEMLDACEARQVKAGASGRWVAKPVHFVW